ncbi:TyrR/PhhR family helix-turn-helix DNA-binding protein [Marinicella litoralis]|uniref:Transcriptional regulator of aroF, aroG, tyrA and aromatic amino acid transport n=1 Tax=Marinicella litoralis TaxID=644220 RepID=A0A4R6XQY5_9GAMM|nr:TyrR/PhhR family helix-turn-helix DNA-binding protein [Marinicella litoralis]TDR20394.1 transcriptional regulator of aroF, aroG, tyrA and aromatic amino acid transport [Marinicella litoralis]
MKLAITTENKLGITDDVLSLLRSHQADLIKVEVEDGKIYLHTQELEKSVQGTIASQLMKIVGIKWVNQIDVLPGVETQYMLESLMQAMPDPVLGINTKGQISYANDKAMSLFQPFTENNKMPLQMKQVFVSTGWQEKVNAAANSHLPVNIKTIAGTMLLEVQGIKDSQGKMNGAMLLFRDYDKIRASSYVMQGEEIDGLERLVYHSDAFGAVLQKAKTVADVDAPLNIVGETGTGKTLLAHACHSLSQRNNELFTVVDCQAMKSDEMEVLLFGTEKRPGVIELNQSGTLFFSHIEFMSQHIQSKFLQHFKQQTKGHCVRVMASSAQKLLNHQQAGKLIPELVLLLDVLRLDVPPLRDRPEDIEPLMQHFLRQFNQQLGQNMALSLDAVAKMKRYYWPGNASQLRHAIYKSMMLAKEGVIQSSDLDLEGAMSLEADLEGMTLNEAVNEFEKHFLQHWYQKFPSTRKLARQLGVSHTTIAQKINKYNLNQNNE